MKATVHAGLIIAGIVFRFALPEAFDAPLMPTFASFGWGTVTGVGVTLSNGCTSGHGQRGCSRFSLRSLACGAYVRTLRHLGEYRLVIHSA